MTTNAPLQLPTKEGVESDLAKVLTVGVGRPTRKRDGPIRDLELVAAHLSDSSLPVLRQVEEVVREAIGGFGATSPFAVAMALVFGTHNDTAEQRGTEKRRELAAKKLTVSEYTMKHEYEKQMHKVLAEQLLKHYAETTSVTTRGEGAPAADQAKADFSRTSTPPASTGPTRPADTEYHDPPSTSEYATPALRSEDQANQAAVGPTQSPATLPASQRWQRHVAVIVGVIIVIILLTVAASALLKTSGRRIPKGAGTGTTSALVGMADALQPSYTSATARLQLVVEVKLRGEVPWSKGITVLPGADVFWMLGTKDVSEARLDNVVLRDVLPPHLKVVPGSVRLVNTSGDRVQANMPLFAGGFNVGAYAPGGALYAVFDTIAQEDFSGCRVTVRDIGKARSDPTSTEAKDSAIVQITKPNCVH